MGGRFGLLESDGITVLSLERLNARFERLDFSRGARCLRFELLELCLNLFARIFWILVSTGFTTSSRIQLTLFAQLLAEFIHIFQCFIRRCL